MGRKMKKNQVEDIDEVKDKEIDKKIPRNFHLIFDRDAILHKVFWIGKNLVDITRAILRKSEPCGMCGCF